MRTAVPRSTVRVLAAATTGVLGFVALPATEAPARAQEGLLPSEALHEIHLVLTRDTTADQGMVTEQWLKRTRRESLEPDERLALAEMYFIGFRPNEADPLFAEFASGTDRRARLATQRRYRMAMAAWDRYDGVEERIRTDRRRLPAMPDDPWHFQPAVSTLAAHYRDRGDHSAVVRVISEELASLPTDGVYFSHTLPGSFFSSYAAVGRRDEAIAHLETVRDAMLTGDRIQRGEVLPDRPHKPGTLHRLEERLLRDQDAVDVQRSLRGRLVGTLYSLLLRQSGGRSIAERQAVVVGRLFADEVRHARTQ